MRKFLLLVVVVGGLYFIFRSDDPAPAPRPALSSQDTSSSSNDSSDSDPDSSSSSSWGSGHQAGYDWAEEKGISDESDCEEAGDKSNSPSFAEGCIAYVNGE